MGLFGLFGKKNKRNGANGYNGDQESLETEGLEKYNGLRVEITTMEGQLLFIAKLTNIQGNMADLYQFTETALTIESPGPIKANIRGYDTKSTKAVYLEGCISPMENHIWKTADLTLIRSGNDRAFFRVETNIAAFSSSLNKSDNMEEPCRLLNISVGGACILSDARYRKGEKLVLKVQPFEERDASLLLCKVLRITEKDYLGFEYGCRFLEMSETEQNKITRIVFDLQQNKIPNRTEFPNNPEEGEEEKEES